MSVAQNSHLTNKPEADGTLILPTPLPLSPLPCLTPSVLHFMGILNYVKLYGKDRSQKKDLWSHLGIELRTCHTDSRTLTNCAIYRNWC